MFGEEGSGEGHCCDREDSCEYSSGREGGVCWEGVGGRGVEGTWEGG